MREALAATSHDFLLRDEKRPEARARGGRGKAKTTAWLRLAAKRRPATVIFIGFVAVTAVGIPLNALYLQDRRHPAPLFRMNALAPEPTGAPQVHAVPAQPPLPPLRPEAVAQSPAQPAKPAAAKSDVARSSEKTRDPIGALLEGRPKHDEGGASVLSAQRALVKLGYVLRPDGVLGGATRQAIEKFERDAGLPVRGDLTPKIIRQLHARAGSL